MSTRIHPTAEVSPYANIGDGTSIWHHAQVRETAQIGKNCIIGKGVYIDAEVTIGDNVKIQNYVSIYQGVHIKNGVFIGPHVCFTNDLRPRAINPDGSLKAVDDWELSQTLVNEGASLGANSTIVCGTNIGAWAMIGSGSVVKRDLPDYGLAWGNPARLHGFACPCGSKLTKKSEHTDIIMASCPDCARTVQISAKLWKQSI